jgi:hypothetical protein
LTSDPRIAAMLALGGLFQNDDLGAEIVGGDRSGDPRRSEPDDDDIGFHVPVLLHSGSISRLTRLRTKRDIAAER